MSYCMYMKALLNPVRKFYRQVRGLIPEAIPTGMTEFNAWAESLASTYHLPTQDMDSVKFTLASIIMHQGPTVAYRSKFFFFLMIRAAVAKQIAGGAFYDIKTRRQQKTAEVTASAAQVTSDGQPVK